MLLKLAGLRWAHRVPWLSRPSCRRSMRNRLNSEGFSGWHTMLPPKREVSSRCKRKRKWHVTLRRSRHRPHRRRLSRSPSSRRSQGEFFDRALKKYLVAGREGACRTTRGGRSSEAFPADSSAYPGKRKLNEGLDAAASLKIMDCCEDPAQRKGDAAGRAEWTSVRLPRGTVGDHLHAQVEPSWSTTRSILRSIGPLLPRDAAASGGQGPVRRPAIWGDGGLGSRSVWGRPHASGDSDGEVRRRYAGRSKVYEAIVKGDNLPHAREYPNRSTCLVKELQALGLWASRSDGRSN